MRELATGAFLDTKRKAIFTGGRRHWQNPSVHWSGLWGIRARARGHLFNLVDLVNRLEQEKAGQSDLA